MDYREIGEKLRETGVILLLSIVGLVSWSAHFGGSYASLQIGLYFVLEPIRAQRHSFQLAILGMHIPRMNGLELTPTIRSGPQIRSCRLLMVRSYII